jgi:ribosomal protein L37E
VCVEKPGAGFMVGRTIGKNLRIVSELGQGGMGVVFLAEHVTLGKPFAVKCLGPELTGNPQFRDRFYREAQAQARLEHPNIVRVTDFFEEGSKFYLVMEYVDGQDLDEMIKRKGRIPEKLALSIFKGILEGLNFAHGKGVIHRDLKPSNIIVDENGTAKIMDFGIAILSEELRLTGLAATMGTAWYMSPEQINRPEAIDHRTDVYSLGIILYEMLTGMVPYVGKTDYAIKQQHLGSRIPDPREKNPEIPDRLSGMIRKALQKLPQDRFDGCWEFLETIEVYEKRGGPGGLLRDMESQTRHAITCPKCGQANHISVDECTKCGVIFAKAHETEKMRDQEWRGREKTIVESLPQHRTRAWIWVLAGTAVALAVLIALISLPHEKEAVLKLTTVPAGAEIFVNNHYEGETPLELALPPDAYKVTFRKDGYAPRQETIALHSGKMKNLTITLKEAVVRTPSTVVGRDTLHNGVHSESEIIRLEKQRVHLRVEEKRQQMLLEEEMRQRSMEAEMDKRREEQDKKNELLEKERRLAQEKLREIKKKIQGIR